MKIICHQRMLLINSLIEISGNIIAGLHRICVTVQYFSVVILGTNWAACTELCKPYTYIFL